MGRYRKTRRAVHEKICRTCREAKPLEMFEACHTSCIECEGLRDSGLKKCRNCNEVKLQSEFYAKPRGKGVDATCKSCASERSRQRNAQNHIRERARERKFRALYGITIADYEAKKDSQGGLCAICSRPAGAKRLHVDHNHVTGGVRDLLCLACNALLGHCKEDPIILSAAIAYLERHERAVQIIS